jgi:hypothetical protein
MAQTTIPATLPLQWKFPDVIDNTLRSSFRKCETYWMYSSINKIKPNSPSLHLHAGGAFAKGIEETRRAFYERNESSEDAIAIGVNALLTFWGDFYVEDTSNKSCERMVQGLLSYFDQYPLETDSIKPYYNPENESYGIEFSFALPIPDEDGNPLLHPETGDPLLYAGRFDMLGDMQGVLFVTDEKTTGQLGNSWLKQWSLDSQFTGYCWAARQYGLPVAGAVIRGISFLTNGNGHAECIIYRPEWQTDRWLVELRRDVRRMIHAFKTRDISQALDKAICGNYGGCSFSMLCESPTPDAWIPIHYEINQWNPLHKED